MLNVGEYVSDCYVAVLQPKLVARGYDMIQITLLKRVISDMAEQAFPKGVYHSLCDIEHFVQDAFANPDLVAI